METICACTCGRNWQNEAYAAFRVITGLLFLVHGYEKIFVMGMDQLTGFFASVGIPFAGIAAPLVAYGEFLGGIALILGLFTHWVAKLNIIIMLGAIYFVHLTNGYGMANGGYEYQLLILAANVLIVTMGAGIYSLDSYLHKKKMISSL